MFLYCTNTVPETGEERRALGSRLAMMIVKEIGSTSCLRIHSLNGSGVREEGRLDKTRVVYADTIGTWSYARRHAPFILARLDLYEVVAKLKCLHVKALVVSNLRRKCNKPMHHKEQEMAPVEAALLIVARLEVDALYVGKARVHQLHKLRFVEVRAEIRHSHAKHLYGDKVDRMQPAVSPPAGSTATAIGGVVPPFLPMMSSSLYL